MSQASLSLDWILIMVNKFWAPNFNNTKRKHRVIKLSSIKISKLSKSNIPVDKLAILGDLQRFREISAARPNMQLNHRQVRKNRMRLQQVRLDQTIANQHCAKTEGSDKQSITL